MVSYKHFSGGLLCFSLGIFLLFSSTKAEPTVPIKYVNLSPFRQWRSAYECMINVTNPCSAMYKLNMSGIVLVSQEHVAGYCTGDCVNHIRYVLKCIHQVKRDFWFANRAHVGCINESISYGCSTNTPINTTTCSSASSMKIYKSLAVPLMTVLTMIIFYI